MNRLVLNDGKVTKERPAPPPLPPLPPVQTQPSQPQNHVWYRLQGRWYPIPRNRALSKGWAHQDEEPGPDETRCEDWQRRIDGINGC